MFELDRKMPASKGSSTAKTSLHLVGVMFVTLSVVSFVLQINFLGSSCTSQEAARIVLEMESGDASASALRRRDQTLAEEADQKKSEADDDDIVTGPKATNITLVSEIGADKTEADNSLSVAVASQPSRPRVLIGIFSADFPTEQRCRHRQRRLLRTYPHVCSLDKYMSKHPADCHLVYTFVLGGNPDAPSTELLDDTSRPWVLPSTAADNPRQYTGKDILAPDVTLLNIRENMNDGKSQTWFAYAAKIAEEHSIDYIVKQDTDTILYLDKFFDFVDTMLPPAPYNRNIMAGSVVDKFWWGADKVNRRAPAEKWAIQRYGGLLHLYVEGQWYLMSPSLANTVQQQALLGPDETSKYFAGHEDHDVSAMAFHSERPINLIIISMQQRHWLHNVKISLGNGRWNRLWERETNRMVRHVKKQLAAPGNVVSS